MYFKHTVAASAAALALTLTGTGIAAASGSASAAVPARATLAAQPASSGAVLSPSVRAVESRSPEAREVLRFYSPFVNGDTGVYEQILAPHWQDIPLGQGQQPGAAGFGPYVQAFRAVLANLQVHVYAVIVAGDYVTVRTQFSGTPVKPFLGVSPNGRPVSFRTVDIHQLRDGKIIQTWHLEDYFTAYSQLTSTP